MLTNENYFSTKNNMFYMGVSQYKSFLECEARTLAELDGDWEKQMSDSLLQGSYVDAHFDGTLDLFKAKNPELFKKDGTLLSKYEHLNYIIERIENQPLMVELLSGEKQKIMTGEISGVPVKIKIDSLLDDKIVDLKCMRSFEPIYKPEQGRLPWYEAWGYDIQGAVYQEIVYQNTGKKLPFILVAATKEKEPDLIVLNISQSNLDFELDRFKDNVVRFEAIKKGLVVPERCCECDYCRHTKKLDTIVNSADVIE